MPLAIESEANQIYEEARSVLGTLIANIMGIVRTIINWAMMFFDKIVTFAGEHPEAFLLSIGNLIIWVS
jgi:hypothetical protein